MPSGVAVEDWRLLKLIEAYMDQKEPLEEGDIGMLCKIADGSEDLHAACEALRKGCPLEQAVTIFT